MEPQFVGCVNNADYPTSLERRKLYQVLPDEVAAKHHQVRIIDESGEDYLYPASLFTTINVPEPVKELLLTSFVTTYEIKPLEAASKPARRNRKHDVA